MKNILIIDDDQTTGKLMQIYIARLGHNCVVMTNASLIINEDISKYDIIFTDLAMPEFTGYDLIKHIKSIDAGKEIYVITGFMREQLDETIIKQVANILTKPVNLKDIENIINKQKKAEL